MGCSVGLHTVTEQMEANGEAILHAGVFSYPLFGNSTLSLSAALRCAYTHKRIPKVEKVKKFVTKEYSLHKISWYLASSLKDLSSQGSQTLEHRGYETNIAFEECLPHLLDVNSLILK
jgi:hypothetical protein